MRAVASRLKLISQRALFPAPAPARTLVGEVEALSDELKRMFSQALRIGSAAALHPDYATVPAHRQSVPSRHSQQRPTSLSQAGIATQGSAYGLPGRQQLQTRRSMSTAANSEAAVAGPPPSLADTPAPAGASSQPASSTSPRSARTRSSPALALATGAAMLPHPDKAHRGGEDSYFISGQNSIGVADGVGGWSEVGIDAGAYARLLMSNACEEAETMWASQPQEMVPGRILQDAYVRTRVQGSSTACVLCLNHDLLEVANIGDSGFLLVRDGRAVFQSPPQQHNFNFPYQLGSMNSLSDSPASAMKFELPLQPNDIVVTGTDGLFDNVFGDEAAVIVSHCFVKGQAPEVAAQVLCRYARMRAADAKYNSPFSYDAIQAGYAYLGGKMDDITVLVSYVQLGLDASPEAPAPQEPIMAKL